MKKRKIIVLAVTVFALIVTGILGTKLYFIHRENVEVQKLLKENEEVSKKFEEAKTRSNKLFILKKFKNGYRNYIAQPDCCEIIEKDYENRIKEMKKYFTKMYEDVIERCTIKEDTTAEEMKEFEEELGQLLEYVEMEKEVVLDGSDSFEEVVTHLYRSCQDNYYQLVVDEKQEDASKDEEEQTAKAAQEAVRAYQVNNHDIQEEEEFYVNYISYLKCGLKDNFRTISPQDLDYSYGYWGEGYFDIYGYCITDLDSDGVKELLIGGNNEELSVVEDIYTIRDGKMIQIAGGWERNRYFLCENGAIANELFESSEVSKYVYSEYKKGALEYVEAVIKEYNGDDDRLYYYGDKKSAQSFGELDPISEEEAKKIKKKYKYKTVPFIAFDPT